MLMRSTGSHRCVCRSTSTLTLSTSTTRRFGGFLPPLGDEAGWNEMEGFCCLLHLFAAISHTSAHTSTASAKISFLHATGWASTRRNVPLVWTVLRLSSAEEPSKGQTVKYWIIPTSYWNETGWWANLLSALKLLKKKPPSLLTKHQQVHEEATQLNEPDNYLNIFPLLLQWAPIKEQGGFKLAHVPEAFIWAWGWTVGVGAGNWFNASEAMPAVENANTQRWQLYLNDTYTNLRAPLPHVINHIICLSAS